MSAVSHPIALHRFGDALRDLPVSRLYDTVAEIRNSQKHLVRSNDELQKYADEGDEDCIKAIGENMVVLERMRQKLDLLKIEVEARGLAWEGCEESLPNGTHDPPHTPDDGNQDPPPREAERTDGVHL